MKTMNILDYMQEHLLYLDGGMGTLLQEGGLAPGEYPERWNLSHPDVIQKIQKDYLKPAVMSSPPIPSVPMP